MQEQPDRRNQAIPGKDPIDLTEFSVSEEGREVETSPISALVESEGPINLLLQAVGQEWSGNQERFLQNQDPDGAELCQKVQLLCEALERLANPVSLRARQQVAVVEMVIAQAAAGSLQRLKDPGNAALACVSIATFINSSSRD